MKVNSSELLKALSVVCRVIPSRPLVPIQEYVTIDNQGGPGSITACSDTLQIAAYFECEGDIHATVHYSALLSYVQKLPQGIDIELITDSTLLYIKWSKGKSSFPLLSEDIPMFKSDGTEVLRMSLKNFKTDIAQLRSFCATDELRPSLCCICIDPDSRKDNAIKLAGFSGACGAVVYDDAIVSNPARVLIHPSAFSTITGMTGDDGQEVTIMTSSNHVFILTEDVILQVRSVDQKYPQYEGVFPINPNRFLSVNKTNLVGAMRRCIACSNMEKTMKFDLGTTCKITSQNLDLSTSAEEELDMFTYDGAEMTIGLSSNILGNAVQIFEDESIKMSFVEPSRAVTLESENDPVKVIIMPVICN